MNTKHTVRIDNIELKDCLFSLKRKILDVNSFHGRWKASDYKLHVFDLYALISYLCSG